MEIKFFFWADKNQMPIKKVCVKYGNGEMSPDCFGPEQNFYQNHYGWHDGGSGASVCDGSDFAHAPQACTGDYATFGTTYTCPHGGTGLDTYSPSTGVTSGWASTCPDTTVSGGGCCVFVPKVQVKDNWGWCNGTCPGQPGGAGDGCYDASDNPASAGFNINECRIANINYASTPFAGKVIVVPR